jgi:hypothetical protein
MGIDLSEQNGSIEPIAAEYRQQRNFVRDFSCCRETFSVRPPNVQQGQTGAAN